MRKAAARGEARSGWNSRARMQARSARRQVARATWARAEGSLLPGMENPFAGGRESSRAANTRERESTASGGSRGEADAISAPMERRWRWALGIQSGREWGGSEASRRPREALVSSMAPRASKRTCDLGRFGRPGREEKPESPWEVEGDGDMEFIGKENRTGGPAGARAGDGERPRAKGDDNGSRRG